MVDGRVTDELGPRAQAFGGDGTVAATVSFRAVTIDAAGLPNVIGESDGHVGGTFSMRLPPNTPFVVIEALDGAGEVRASALLESTSRSQGQSTCTPLNSESTLEAKIWMALRQQWQVPAAEISIGDLRARIDAHLAEAVRNKANALSPEATDADVAAIAFAIHVAQQARVAALRAVGVDLSLEDLADEERGPSQALSNALFYADDEDAAYDAHTEFLAALRSVTERLAPHPGAASDAASAAGFAFRSVVETHLPVDASSANILHRAIAAAARAEGQARPSVQDFLRWNSMLYPARDVSLTLSRSLGLAMTTTCAEDAWRAYRRGILDEEEPEGTVVFAVYSVTPAEGGFAAFLDELDRVRLSEDVLRRRLRLFADSIKEEAFDPTEAGEDCATAFVDYRANAQAILSALPEIGPDAGEVSNLVVESKTAFWTVAP